MISHISFFLNITFSKIATLPFLILLSYRVNVLVNFDACALKGLMYS